MFSLSELAPLNQHQNQCKLLKPWWEVFMDYLGVLMLLASVLACTEQLSRDKLLCIPLDPRTSRNPVNIMEQITTQQPPTPPPTINSQPQGRRTHLVYQQYVYISQVCYYNALPFCSRFFPYMALMQSLILVASGSFWLHFPHTSARIEHFLTILSKCCESPWTSQSLFQTAQQETTQDKNMTNQKTLPHSLLHLPSMKFIRHTSIDSGSDSPLLKRVERISTTAPPSLCPSNKPSCSLSTQAHPSKMLAQENDPQHDIILDKNDVEQARALFEKVRKFRSHTESSSVIYKVYLAQTVFKLLLVVLIGSYTIPLLSSFSFTHNCDAEEQALVGYSSFQCVHVLSSLLRKLLLAYMSLLGIYGLLNLYTLGWILHSALCQYSFQTLKDTRSLSSVPDLRNDLAFLLHMLEQYDPLLVERLSVFLSPQSDSHPGEQDLECCWGEEQLRSMVTVDTEGCSRLALVALSKIPPALYTLSHLHVLKLELITAARFTSQLSNMASLRELHLYHCSAAVDPDALNVLQDHLEVLHITFSQPSQIPGWVLLLRNLQQLHLSGHFHSEGGVARGWPLGSLRSLHHLRVLVIRNMLQRVPGGLSEVVGSLVKLEIHNEGTRLLAHSGLKRLIGLTELVLQDCQLEHLPSALTALRNLHSLDLQHNKLGSLEEIIILTQLRCLSKLRLAYNHILAIPPCISLLQSLQLLDLSNNQLHSLPPALFSLHSLHTLLLSGNVLQQLPCEVKALQLLTELDISGNRLESLPQELFNCLKLHVLKASHNYLQFLPGEVGALTELCRLDLRCNSLKELPFELVQCSGLKGEGLLVEDWLFLTLPPQVRDLLSQCSSPQESDSFPYFSPTLWSFYSGLESQI